MAYNFNKKTKVKHYEVEVDTESMYGNFEHDELGDESGGGLWFAQKEGYVIAGPTVDGELLYWNNLTGWGSRDTATLFYDAHPGIVGATCREATWGLELTDYDGVASLPKSVVQALKDLDIYVGEEFE